MEPKVFEVFVLTNEYKTALRALQLLNDYQKAPKRDNPVPAPLERLQLLTQAQDYLNIAIRECIWRVKEVQK